MADELKIKITAEDGASKTFKTISSSATTMGDALEKAGAEGTKGLDQLDKAAASNAKSMERAKAEATAIGAVLGTLAAVTMKAGQANRDQERSIATIGKLYGDAAQEMLAYSERIQDTTRYSNDAARQAEIIFATLSNNYGVTTAQLDTLLTRTTDLAAAHGRSLEETAQMVQNALRGEAEYIEAVGVTLNDNYVAAQAAARGIEGWTTSMSDAEKAAFRYTLLMEQTNNLQGTAAEQAANAGGKFRQFANEMQDSVAAVGSFLGPVGDLAAELAPVAIAAPLAGAGISRMATALKGSASAAAIGRTALAGLSAVVSPLGLALTGIVAVGGFVAKSWMDQKQKAQEYKVSLAELGDVIELVRRKGDQGLATLGQSYEQTITSLSDRMNDLNKKARDAAGDFEDFEYRRLTELMGQGVPQSQALSQIQDEWAQLTAGVELSVDQITGLSDKAAQALSNPDINAEGYLIWSNAMLSTATTAEDLEAAVAAIDARPLTDFATQATKAEVAAKALGASVKDIKLDDLRISGKFDIVDDLQKVDTALTNLKKSWTGLNDAQKATLTQDLLPEEQAAVYDRLAASQHVSTETAKLYADAQERINETVAAGSIDNKALLSDLEAIRQQRAVNIAAGMNETEANELAAQAVISLSANLGEYTLALTTAQQAQIDFTTSGANVLEFFRRVQAGTQMGLQADLSRPVAEAERMVASLAAGLDVSGKALDSVLATFSRIDALGDRSSNAASIAESMIGNADELGALPKLMDDIAAGTSRATLSQQDYVQAMGAGRAIIASNVQVQDLLTSVRAKQLPYLAAQQVAYENNIAALERMSAADQRRVLMLQDTNVQQGLAAAGALQLQSTYTNLTSAQVDQLATQALLNPEIAESLELYKALRVNADGYYEVLTGSGWVASNIEAVTDAVSHQGEMAQAAAGSWEAWKAEAAAAGMTAEELEKNLEGLKGTLIEVSGLGDSLAGIGMMGLGSESTGLAGNLIQSGAALESAYRVIVSNTEGIKGQFQSLYDWGEKLIGEQGVWARIDDLQGLELLKPGQYEEAQAAFTTIAAVNEQVANSIDAIQVGLAPVLADAAEKQAAYIEQLRGMGEAQQLATLGWMDSAESARAFSLATLAADAAAGKFGETGMEMANQAILAAANMDPVIAKMLESIGLIKEVDGDYVVQFDAVDNASDTIGDLNNSLKIFTLLAMGVPPAVIKAEVQGKGDVDDLYDSLLGIPPEKQVTVKVQMDMQAAMGPTLDPGGMQSALGAQTSSLTVPVTASVTSLDTTAIDGLGETKITVSANTDAATQAIGEVQSAIDALPKDTPIAVTASTSDAVSSINAVTETIALVPKSTEVTVSALTGDAVANINAVISALDSVYSKTVVLDVVTQYTTIGSPSAGARGVARHGGVPGYAMGGVLFEAGEAGPEMAHFAGGGTALIPDHGLYVAPPHTYIEPANSVATKLSPGTDGPLVNIEQLIVGAGATPADADAIAREIITRLERALEHRLRGGGLA
ncbi:MAG: hypothetical protein WBA63_04875 [Thermomicrobiales bacterium]